MVKIFVSIIFNALILYAITFLLWENVDKWIEAWVIVSGWWKTYIIWWFILWVINVIIRPILKILSLPLFFVFLWLVSFVINGVIIWLLDYILNNILMIDWVSYEIKWVINFIIAVAIFTILNTLYSLLFSKKN
jgi:putative membrane protein